MANFGANSAVDSTVAPIVVPPSTSWDGNDGPWSTFDIHVGTPPQAIRVLASTTFSWTLVVSDNSTQGGCLADAPPDCASLRGGLININSSNTWHDQGIYDLGMETNLPDYNGEYDNGDYGFDALGLGLPGSAGLNFKSQTIAAIATDDFYLGSLGINPQLTNFSATNEQISFLTSLKQSNNSPSLSYGYSAGARYRQNTTATLTLGGYDASKIIKSNFVSFSMSSDTNRNLVVNLQNVTLNSGGNKSLLPTSIPTFIDSTVPHLWLPRDSCTLFENAFGISYNNTVDRYLVDDQLHRQLETSNASVSFLLHPLNSTGETAVNITLPYSSFDLEIGSPTVNTTQRYFPLRRAENETQYTLGRTFLQEAYLIVDYERSNFSVSQINWASNAKPQIVPIKPVTDNVPQNTTNTVNRLAKSRTIAGSTIGASILLTLCLALALYLARRRNAMKSAERIRGSEANDGTSTWGKPEMDAQDQIRAELETTAALPTDIEERTPMELQGNLVAELHEPLQGILVAELQENSVGPELAGSMVGVENGGDVGVVELKSGAVNRSL